MHHCTSLVPFIWQGSAHIEAEQEEFVIYVEDDKVLDRLPGEFYATRSFTDFLIQSIRENRDDGKPFFAYLAFTAPHDPMHVPEPWLSKYRGRYDEGYDVLKVKRAAAAKRLATSRPRPLAPPVTSATLFARENIGTPDK